MSIDVAGSNVSGSGTATITVNPTDLFLPNASYYITIDATAFDDVDGDSYAGIADSTTLNFTVGTSMPDPTQDADTVALIEGQIDISKRFIQHSTFAVLDRIEWIRRNKEQKDLSHQGTQLSFSDPALNQLSDHLSLTTMFNPLVNFLPSGWSIWTSGNVSIGKIGSTDTSSEKKINSNGVSLGLDKKINEKSG